MSHFARLIALVSLSLAAACSSSKPPATPEAAAAEDPPAEPTTSEPSEPTASASPAPSADATVSPGGRLETLFVRDRLGTCEAEGARQCLMVRGSESEEWRNFYGSIAGFEYEPSYSYELRVEVTPIEGAPADAPSLRYRLLEVVSKSKSGS
jgi:uncharacterized protein DUF4377